MEVKHLIVNGNSSANRQWSYPSASTDRQPGAAGSRIWGTPFPLPFKGAKNLKHILWGKAM